MPPRRRIIIIIWLISQTLVPRYYWNEGLDHSSIQLLKIWGVASSTCECWFVLDLRHNGRTRLSYLTRCWCRWQRGAAVHVAAQHII
jgi:hypothetical protein